MMQLDRAEGCVTDLTFDRWASGELSAPAREHTQAHVSTCARCRERRAALEAERAAFFAAAPSFNEHAARFAGKRQRGQARWGRYAIAGGVLALAAAALLAYIPRAAPGTRQKGGPSLGYFVKRGPQVLRADAGTGLHPGDLVRFTYNSKEPRYLALLSRDAQGANVYYPAGPRAQRVQSDKDVGLDFSVELDDTLGDEHVYGLFCRDVFEIAPVLRALRESGHVSAPDTCQLVSLTLHKVPAP